MDRRRECREIRKAMGICRDCSRPAYVDETGRRHVRCVRCRERHATLAYWRRVRDKETADVDA
jgi:hypothetical protein